MLAVNLFISTSKVLINDPFYPGIYRIRGKLTNSLSEDTEFYRRDKFGVSPASAQGLIV
jgi:hypothetical protein